jgi:hypothetical protein
VNPNRIGLEAAMSDDQTTAVIERYLEADEVLGAVVERLLKAMREIRPGTVRQFFALANQRMRWELNDLARRLDTLDHPFNNFLILSIVRANRGGRGCGVP